MDICFDGLASGETFELSPRRFGLHFLFLFLWWYLFLRIILTPTFFFSSSFLRAEPQRTEGGVFGLLADSFEKLLLQIQDVEKALGIPYPVGNSIIILTALVKLVTFPLTKSQVVSSLNMKNLQPQVAAIKEKYEDDPERMNSEINRIYEENEVNPLAGCGPLILTLPVFIGLYRAFKNAGIDGVFDEPWLFIPNLSGPSDAQDISWLWP